MTRSGSTAWRRFLRIIDQLVGLADVWAGNHGRSKARLATIVVNDGNFFKRIEKTENCNLNTFEKFLSFFRDPANWPDDIIPDAAVRLLEQLDNISTEPTEVGGKSHPVTGVAIDPALLAGEVA